LIPQSKQELAARIDHSLLSPTAVEADIRRLCAEAAEYRFASVCVTARWVSLAADLLRGSGVRTAAVVGFPLGTSSPRLKALEAEEAVMNGADELDMVADLAAVVEQDERGLRRDLEAVWKVCRQMNPPVVLKVIIESAALTDEQIVFVCRIGQEIGVDFLKTSTGMHKAGGATPEHVRLMAQTAPRCKIKASGGIRTAQQALTMLQAGASRLGTSSSVQILQEFSPAAE
jgi:deoxyribose-phosphate aldolase